MTELYVEHWTLNVILLYKEQSKINVFSKYVKGDSVAKDLIELIASLLTRNDTDILYSQWNWNQFLGASIFLVFDLIYSINVLNVQHKCIYSGVKLQVSFLQLVDIHYRSRSSSFDNCMKHL